MDDRQQSKGRDENAALPLGRRDGQDSEERLRKIGEESRKRAGPDGPDATEIGDTFKKKP